jgi:hypothetical protein
MQFFEAVAANMYQIYHKDHRAAVGGNQLWFTDEQVFGFYFDDRGSMFSNRN